MATIIHAEPVLVSLQDLRTGTVPLSTLEEAFGPSSLGILVVKDLEPQFVALRHRLLSYASYLAHLPSETLKTLECPSAKYLTGWSHGKEALKEGVFDVQKGSYYVNCAFYQDDSIKEQHDFPEMTTPNVWPPEEVLPGFRSTFEELANLIIRTAVFVARACDQFGEASITDYEQGCLEKAIHGSRVTKARMLHYFPITEQRQLQDSSTDDDDNWCSTHIDHGCLTGLTSALYIDEDANPPTIPKDKPRVLPPLNALPSAPDPVTGLYIKSRTSELVKVSIPSDCLAFQTGEALEIMTKGRFKAVPHLVRAGKPGSGKVARNTLAVFTQPNLDDVIDSERGLTFGGFSKIVAGRFG